RQPRAYLPRIDLWSDNYVLGATSTARLWFGSDAVAGPMKADLTIDSISAGKLCASSTLGADWDGHESSGGPALPNIVSCGIERFFKGAADTYAIGPDLGDITGVIVQATTPLFDFTIGKMGLVLIQGEVFAYQRPSEIEAAAVATRLASLQATTDFTGIAVYTAAEVRNNGMFAKLIARGLLDVIDRGTVGTTHTIADGPVIDTGLRAPHRPLLEAIRLPLGPVLRCANDITASAWHILTDVDTSAPSPVPVLPLNAPAALMCSAGGETEKAEILQFIGPNLRVIRLGDTNPDQGKYTTADWLRGLYNTNVNTWAAADSPLVIGWWPRYASALPTADSTVTQHFACRSYAWVGFPTTVYGGYFLKGLLDSFPTTGPFPYRGEPMAEVVVSEHFKGFFDVEARALADNNDWANVTWKQQQPVSLITGSNASAVFSPPNDACGCFSNGVAGALTAKPVDGAELRVTWHYSKTPSSNLRSVAESGGRTPVIDRVRMRCLAPVRVLANERAR
ncbi:MAG: hypothetical protein H0W83_16370, partial [Planctomycetes bacterium]|nr:hypothetical protein [Planctomycetota bacterium]